MRTTYKDYGINWMWYLIATIHEDSSATIHEHFRLHKYENDIHPETEHRYELRQGKLTLDGIPTVIRADESI